DDISRRYRSRSTTLDMPEDANFYYGGPNPNKVLFDHYTGEGKPIFYRDFLNENYRIYYRLYRFASQKYPSSILFFKERSWVLQIFEEDTPSAKRFLLSPGPSYLYSFKRLSFDYQLNLIITYDDVARDKLGNEVEDFYDTHVWEHVWRKGFGRRAP